MGGVSPPAFTEILIAVNWDLTKCRVQNAECRVKEDFRKRKSKLGFIDAFNSQGSVGTGVLDCPLR